MTYKEYLKKVEELAFINTMWARKDLSRILEEAAADKNISDRQFEHLNYLSCRGQ